VPIAADLTGAVLPGAVPPPAGSSLLVAVSGGPDSTALLRWLVGQGATVTAAHYDHALRAGSDADAVHVAELCRKLEVTLITERRQRPMPGGSLQAAARELRYAFLERARRDAGCELVATGHTADDVVEGVCLHLLRGSGLAGLRGMPERRGPYVRPFLRVWRAEIERYLGDLGERALRDPSNDLVERYARARVRHRVLPALERARPGIGRRIHALAMRAAGWQALLEAEADAIGDDRERLRAAPCLVRAEVYRHLFGVRPALNRRQLHAIDRLLMDGRTGDGVDLPGGRRARLEPRRLSIEAATSPPPPLPRLELRTCPGCGEEGAVHLVPGCDTALVRIGRRRPGLRLRLAGGTRKLQDVLVDARVPRHLRDDLALVFVGDRLAWVPGVAADRELTVPLDRPGIHLQLACV
jgi:tRNA(Ile)-lysidine synthase